MPFPDIPSARSVSLHPPSWLSAVADGILPPRGRMPEKTDGGSALLRLLAMGAVIGIHMDAFFPLSGGGTAGRDVIHALYACCFWSVPAFVLLSGYHAMADLDALPPSAYFGKRLWRLLVPLLFWGLVYTWLPSGSGWTGMEAVARDWLQCSPAFHLWYIFMLVGLCLVAPLCGRWAKNAWAWGAVAVFQLVVMADPVFWISGIFRCPLLISVPYVGLFTLGCRLSIRGIGRGAGRTAALAAVAYFCCMIFISLHGAGRFRYPFYNYLGLGGLWGGLSVTVAVLHAGKSFPPALSAFLFRLSKAVFGTYLVHPLLMGAFAKMLPPEAGSAAWFRPVLVFGVFAASMALSSLLLKIPGLRRVV